jgi:hypothetical protein
MGFNSVRPKLTVETGKGAQNFTVVSACEGTPLVTACKKRFGITAGFRSGANNSRVLLGHYTAYSGQCFPTFRVNLSVPSSSVKNSIFIDSSPLNLGYYAAYCGNSLPTFRDN